MGKPIQSKLAYPTAPWDLVEKQTAQGTEFRVESVLRQTVAVLFYPATARITDTLVLPDKETARLCGRLLAAAPLLLAMLNKHEEYIVARAKSGDDTETEMLLAGINATLGEVEEGDENDFDVGFTEEEGLSDE